MPVLLILAACGSSEVTLDYRLAEGRALRYSLRLEADVRRTLETTTLVERIEATFRAGQEIVEQLEDGRALARMTLDPISLQVNGEAENVGAGQEFLVTLGPEGEVESVEEATPGAADSLAPVGIERLLPRLRPVLPPDPVSPGETWTSETRIADEDGTFSIEARSRLAELERVGGRPSALVRTTYVSPVDRREIFANAVADLSGRDVGTQEAWFSLEGFLLRARGDSVGRFDVDFRPPGGEDTGVEVQGNLVVRLHTELTLVP